MYIYFNYHLICTFLCIKLHFNLCFKINFLERTSLPHNGPRILSWIIEVESLQEILKSSFEIEYSITVFYFFLLLIVAWHYLWICLCFWCFLHSNVSFKVKISLSFFFFHSWVPIRRRQWHPTPVLLPGKSHGQRSLVGCSPWGREESDMTEDFTLFFFLELCKFLLESKRKHFLI